MDLFTNQLLNELNKLKDNLKTILQLDPLHENMKHNIKVMVVKQSRKRLLIEKQDKETHGNWNK